MAERFVSPGVFTREKDLSFLPQEIAAIGGAVIGPTLYGPAWRPTTISNYSEYLRTFGNTFISGSGQYAQEYKYLTNYTAQEYLRYGDNLTVLRILNPGATIAYSNIVSSGSYHEALNAGSGSSDFSSSIFTAADASFRLHLLSEGKWGNSGDITGSINGLEHPSDIQSNGALKPASGSRVNYRWEISGINKRRGTFDLTIRRGDDRTGRKVVMETYNDLSLDPNSTNYISRVIGDQVLTLRGGRERGGGKPYLQLSGSYPNRSRIVRVEVFKNTLNFLDANDQVRDAALTASLPAAVSGTFSGGSDGQIQHPMNFFDRIGGVNSTVSNTQGFLFDSTGSNGSSAYYDAIDILSNAEEYDINTLFMPGIVEQGPGNHSEIITYAIAMCEDRGDVFLVVDPTKYGDGITLAQQSGEQRTSNYAAMYYPWVQVSDPDLNRNVWIPPSCVVAGALTFNDYVAFPWFAPAGLNRGGIEVAVQAELKLSRAMRDDLYQSSVNPIATYPREGVVIWGQKTLQKKRSALDRINVRRLLIAAKKYVASVSKYLVFEQNTVETRRKFVGIVSPYFADVQQKQGLYDFKVIMDESNNTPEVVDRNELRGAIYLKPTKTAEFLIVDFYVYPTGATFPGDSPTGN
jgi:hypothetical protein